MNILFGPEKNKRINREAAVRKAADILDAEEHQSTIDALNAERGQSVGISAEEMERSMQALVRHGNLRRHEIKHLSDYLNEHLEE